MTTRSYECDGYSMLLEASADGAWITLKEGAWSPANLAIRVPWKVMAELCGVVSRWECSAHTRYADERGQAREITTFE